MNLFNRSASKYPLTEQAKRQGMSRNLKMGGYAVLALLVLVTGFHALMIVLTQTAGFEIVGWDGLIAAVFTLMRAIFPLVVELGAAISIVGSMLNVWRGDQKAWAGRIDAAWLTFAALNMVTFWGIERGAELEGWQNFWLQWGMPVSGLIVGWMVIVMIRSHPDRQRAEEEAEAEEELNSQTFNDQQAMLRSPEMRTVRQRKAWRDYANSLVAQGYTQEEADFILAQVPDLQASRQAPKPVPRVEDTSLVDAFLSKLGMSKTTQDNAPRYATLDGVDVLRTYTTEELMQAAEQLALARRAPVQGDKPNGPPPSVIGARPEDFR